MPEDLVGIIEMELARALRAVDRAAMVASALEAHLPRSPQGVKARETARRVRKVRAVLVDAGIHLPPLRKIGEYRIPEEGTVSDSPALEKPALSSRPPGPPWTVAGLARLAQVSRTTSYRWALRIGIKGNGVLTAAEARAVLCAGGRTDLADLLRDPVE